MNGLDYSTAQRVDSAEYVRCKVTHRCNYAYRAYDVPQAAYHFTKRIFTGGRHDDAVLFTDFENWEAGTTGWVIDPAYLDGHVLQTRGAHMNSFDFELLGPIWRNATATLHFDTTSLEATYTTLDGGVSSTRVIDGKIFEGGSKAAEIATWTFDSLYLGPSVTITVSGIRSLAILSRSTMYIDTPINVPHGELAVRI